MAIFRAVYPCGTFAPGLGTSHIFLIRPGPPAVLRVWCIWSTQWWHFRQFMIIPMRFINNMTRRSPLKEPLPHLLCLRYRNMMIVLVDRIKTSPSRERHHSIYSFSCLKKANHIHVFQPSNGTSYVAWICLIISKSTTFPRKTNLLISVETHLRRRAISTSP